jgi:CRP-like cAMP-binding protein
MPVLVQTRPPAGRSLRAQHWRALASSPFHRLILRLEAIGSPSDFEKEAIADLPITLRQVRGDEDIVREGQRPRQSCLLLDGFLHRYKMLPDGTRQIMSFHVPGDLPDLESLNLGVMDHSLAALTASTVAFIPHDALHALTHSHPRIADLFWRATLIDAAIFREWIVNIGSRDAQSRIAHLICEIYVRLKAVELTSGFTFRVPVTQGEIGEATGLSNVHVNRSIQKLRAERLITWDKVRCTIEDWDGLAKVAMFDPTYLYQKTRN